jgi:crotonobetainyl-CoA:carnitine CoA-transferase CaiB-like acyl-CoA transferase
MTGLLEGLRVVEVALLAPNALGMHLADMGADVVKVEEPGRGDYTRSVGAARSNGISFLHLRWNRGKRSVAVDLRSPDGVEVFKALVAKSEVVIEGLRAGALARRGLGFEDLKEVNPAIVFCSLSGFGQTGPYRDLATHGVAYDAYAGHAPPETTADGFPTIPARYTEVGTTAGALYAAFGVVSAVLHARATGQGCHLDVAQADAAVSWAAGRLDPALTGMPPMAAKDVSMHGAVRYQYYATSDGRFILFQASEKAFFENFCRALGREDLLERDAGEEVGEHARNDLRLRAELADIFVTRTQEEWVAFFLEVDVPGVEHDHPIAGPWRLLGSPILTGAPPVAIGPAPETGEHTDEILREVLGYDDARIDALKATGVVR